MISKRNPLIILGITALACSRAFFALLKDPEGPNLLIVVALAAILYSLAWVVYSRAHSMRTSKKVLLGVVVQLAVVALLYWANMW